MHIYLDFNASTPVAPEVAARMEAVLHEPFGNPSSDHWAGTAARAAVETARAQVAGLLGCDAGEVIFTSGGSEANNHAIKGTFFATGVEHPHIIKYTFEYWNYAQCRQAPDVSESLGLRADRPHRAGSLESQPARVARASLAGSADCRSARWADRAERGHDLAPSAGPPARTSRRRREGRPLRHVPTGGPAGGRVPPRPAAPGAVAAGRNPADHASVSRRAWRVGARRQRRTGTAGSWWRGHADRCSAA